MGETISIPKGFSKASRSRSPAIRYRARAARAVAKTGSSLGSRLRGLPSGTSSTHSSCRGPRGSSPRFASAPVGTNQGANAGVVFFSGFSTRTRLRPGALEFFHSSAFPFLAPVAQSFTNDFAADAILPSGDLLGNTTIAFTAYPFSNSRSAFILPVPSHRGYQLCPITNHRFWCQRPAMARP